MTRKMISGRWGAAALLAVLLVTAAPVEASPVPGSWARLFTWLGGWSGFGPLLAATFGEEGTVIDPDGSWGTGQGDEGPAIDPNGSWSTSGQGDEGPIIDPDGSWGTSGQGDEGPIIDPNGRKG